MKALAIRLDEEQHAQLTMLAQLDELTVTDAIRQAINQWIETKRQNPKLIEQAEAVLAEIERDAANRRGAIAALFGGEQTAPTTAQADDQTPDAPERPGRARRGGSATS
jgi:hypothetical protein